MFETRNRQELGNKDIIKNKDVYVHCIGRLEIAIYNVYLQYLHTIVIINFFVKITYWTTNSGSYRVLLGRVHAKTFDISLRFFSCKECRGLELYGGVSTHTTPTLLNASEWDNMLRTQQQNKIFNKCILLIREWEREGLMVCSGPQSLLQTFSYLLT